MALQTAPKEKEVVALPRSLHLCTVVGLRYPFITAVLVVLECAMSAVLLHYTGQFEIAPNIMSLGGCGLCMLLILGAARSITTHNLLRDLLDFVGETEFKTCVAQVNWEVRIVVLPAVVTGGLPIVGYFLLIEDIRANLSNAMVLLGRVLLAFVVVAGPCLSVSFAWGCVVMVRMVAALLRISVDKVFEHLEATLMREELSTEETIDELDGLCKGAKRVFERANKCITKPVFSVVVIGYLISLGIVLELVVSVQGGGVPIFVLLTFTGLAVIAGAFATALLLSLTSVADHYEDVASDFTHNLELRFKLTKAFPGPAGVKLFSSFESEYINDLSFNVHHRALDARTLESAIMKLGMGAVVTVGLGMLTS
eukprot:CAMPEP_0171067626 /NCGR_PEP_ID=MMETSP0766_2-20121228/8104_1 /TAXON_ID=439317 /ORGANISM="Gambierdiscus australes, Strain CAWD 149" /LENGTH=367 /DNA_ID=CAMNT_0011523879 /DNA_START=39 /DNA_END=1142 /DNA_ORIENTATION=+